MKRAAIAPSLLARRSARALSIVIITLAAGSLTSARADDPLPGTETFVHGPHAALHLKAVDGCHAFGTFTSPDGTTQRAFVSVNGGAPIALVRPDGSPLRVTSGVASASGDFFIGIDSDARAFLYDIANRRYIRLLRSAAYSGSVEPRFVHHDRAAGTVYVVGRFADVATNRNRIGLWRYVYDTDVPPQSVEGEPLPGTLRLNNGALVTLPHTGTGSYSGMVTAYAHPHLGGNYLRDDGTVHHIIATYSESTGWVIDELPLGVDQDPKLIDGGTIITPSWRVEHVFMPDNPIDPNDHARHEFDYVERTDVVGLDSFDQSITLDHLDGEGDLLAGSIYLRVSALETPKYRNYFSLGALTNGAGQVVESTFELLPPLAGFDMTDISHMREQQAPVDGPIWQVGTSKRLDGIYLYTQPTLWRAASAAGPFVPTSYVPSTFSNAQVTSRLNRDGWIFSQVTRGAGSSFAAFLVVTRPTGADCSVPFNTAPSANAGPDQRVPASLGTAAVTLDGRASRDDENNPLSFTWHEGANVIATGPNPTVTLNGFGRHILSVVVDDGRSGSASDVVNVELYDPSDTTPPVFANAPYLATVACGGPNVDLRNLVSVTDNSDPDVDVTVAPYSTSSPTLGTPLVLAVTATDGAGNTATTTITVTVADNAPPVLQSTPPVAETLECHYAAPWQPPNVTAIDQCDGAVAVTRQGNAIRSQTGHYVITFTATDRAGNTVAFDHTVTVADTVGPGIGVGSNGGFGPERRNHWLECNAAFAPLYVNAFDLCTATSFPTSSITVTGSVNATTAGTYPVTYSATDTAGNEGRSVIDVHVIGNARRPEVTVTQVSAYSQNAYPLGYRILNNYSVDAIQPIDLVAMGSNTSGGNRYAVLGTQWLGYHSYRVHIYDLPPIGPPVLVSTYIAPFNVSLDHIAYDATRSRLLIYVGYIGLPNGLYSLDPATLELAPVKLEGFPNPPVMTVRGDELLASSLDGSSLRVYDIANSFAEKPSIWLGDRKDPAARLPGRPLNQLTYSAEDDAFYYTFERGGRLYLFAVDGQTLNPIEQRYLGILPFSDMRGNLVVERDAADVPVVLATSISYSGNAYFYLTRSYLGTVECMKAPGSSPRSWLLPVATASDLCDGTRTATTSGTFNPDFAAPGVHEVDVSAVDTAGNEALPVTVATHFTDPLAPELSVASGPGSTTLLMSSAPANVTAQYMVGLTEGRTALLMSEWTGSAYRHTIQIRDAQLALVGNPIPLTSWPGPYSGLAWDDSRQRFITSRYDGSYFAVSPSGVQTLLFVAQGARDFNLVVRGNTLIGNGYNNYVPPTFPNLLIADLLTSTVTTFVYRNTGVLTRYQALSGQSVMTHLASDDVLLAAPVAGYTHGMAGLDQTILIVDPATLNIVGAYSLPIAFRSIAALHGQRDAAGRLHLSITGADTSGNLRHYELRHDPILVEVNESHTLPLVTVSDCEPYVQATLVGPQSIATTSAGVGHLQYQAVDSAGNIGRMTVDVAVLGPKPIVVLNGNSPMMLGCGDVYAEPGASLIDGRDGVSDAIVTGPPVTTSQPGSFVRTYGGSDNAGNLADEVARTVTVVNAPPMISLNNPFFGGSTPFSMGCQPGYLEYGATAVDACDGDLTNAVVIAGGWAALPGPRSFTYTVTDSGGASASVTRSFNIYDNNPPQVALVGANPMIVEVLNTYVEPGANATDDCDGVTLAITGTPNTQVVGIYQVTYRATDTYGNQTSRTREVRVVDSQPPTLTLRGNSALQLECSVAGSTADPGVDALDNYDAQPRIETGGAVFFGVQGIFTRTYRAFDSAGNGSAVLTRTFEIRDTTPPLVQCPAAPLVIDAGPQCRTNAPTVTGLVTASDPGACATEIPPVQGVLTVTAPSPISYAASPVDFPITMSGGGFVNQVKVTVTDIDSNYTQYVAVKLVAPDGTEVELGNGNGSGSQLGYVGTVFDPCAFTSINGANAPFTGTFQPRGDLRALVGKPVDGAWKLRVSNALNNASTYYWPTVHGWTLELGRTVAPTTTPAACPTRTGSFDEDLVVSDNAMTNIPDNNAVGITRTITVTEANLGGLPDVLEKLQVRLWITHTYLGDLKIYLKPPGVGTSEANWIPLALNRYGSNDDYGSSSQPAIFDDQSIKLVGQGVAPYLGLFKPEQNMKQRLAALGITRVTGAWSIVVRDTGGGDFGTLRNWALAFDVDKPAVVAAVTGAILTQIPATNTVFTTPGPKDVRVVATDTANNIAECHVTVQVADRVAPSIVCPTGQPLVAVGANGELPNLAHLVTATDACVSAPLPVTHTPAPGTAVSTLGTQAAVTFTTSDGVNSASCTTTVRFGVDTTPPSLTCPPGVSLTAHPLSCAAAVPDVRSLATVSDDETASGNITLVQVPAAGALRAAGAHNITLSATDSAGNSATCNTTLTIVDATAPVIAAPGAKTIECGASSDPSATGQATASDACGGSVSVSHADTQVDGALGTRVITRTWSGSDARGNTATRTQVITASDTTAPLLSAVPANVNAACDAIPATASVSATDACDPTPAVVFAETRVDGSHPFDYVLRRTWTATDAAGFATSGSQNVTVSDSASPVFSGVPANASVSCDAVPGLANVSANDACFGDVTPVFAETRIDGSSPYDYTLVRSWTATDGGNNSGTSVQTLTVADMAPPMLTVPENIVVACEYIAWWPTGIATASDSCDPYPTVTFSDARGPGLGQIIEHIARTWRAEDSAGRFVMGVQTIAVEDLAPPILTLPGFQIIACGGSSDPAATGMATAYDACGGDVDVSFADDVTEDFAGYVRPITRTWNATDRAGNGAQGTQYIWVTDYDAPILSPRPDDLAIACDAEVPTVATITATDACDGPVDVTFSESTQGDVTSRTWSASDPRGNVATHTQLITRSCAVLTAIADLYATTMDTVLVVPASIGLFANDVLVGNPVAILDTAPSGGTLMLEPDGAFSFEPSACISGEVSFSYHLYDALADLSSPSATVAIQVASRPPSFELGTSEASLGEGQTATGTVRRRGDCTLPVKVTCYTQANTATATSDFTTTTSILTFAAGEAEKPCNVTTIDDVVIEGTESFYLRLKTPSLGTSLGRQRVMVVTLADNDDAGTFSLDALSTSVAESGEVALQVRRSAATPGTSATVKWTALAGSAGASDFALLANETKTLSFGPTDDVRTITLKVVHDTLVEGRESFRVGLTSPSAGSRLGANRNAVVTIDDDDEAGVIELAALTTVVDEGAVTVQLDLVRTGASVGTGATVMWAAAAGSAGALDYAYVDGDTRLVEFAPGQTSKAITVRITDDLLAEGDESFRVALSAPSAGAWLGATRYADVIIRDDDLIVPAGGAGTFSLGALSTSVAESADEVTMQVLRTGATPGTSATVKWTVSAGSAGTSDFALLQGETKTLSFGPDDVARTITVKIADDALVEGHESFRIGLTSPSTGSRLGAQRQAVVTILDDDDAGVIELANVVTVVDEGAVDVQLELVRTGASPRTGATVKWAVAAGSAGALDYALVENETKLVAFAPGETSKFITVRITDDKLEEGVESFRVALSGPTAGARLGAKRYADVLIRDDDTAAVYSLPQAVVFVAEGAAELVLRVVRSHGIGAGSVAIKWSASIATSPADFLAGGPLVLAFPDGETEAMVTVPLYGDGLIEGNETFNLVLSSPLQGTLAPLRRAVVVIRDDD